MPLAYSGGLAASLSECSSQTHPLAAPLAPLAPYASQARPQSFKAARSRLASARPLGLSLWLYKTWRGFVYKSRERLESGRYELEGEVGRILKVFEAGETKMRVENAVYPTAERIKSLSSERADGPIAMVNLLKFRAKAVYKDGRPGEISGREAYMRYATEMRKIVEGAGGRFVFAGSIDALVIGEVEELWDFAAIVEYPSRAAFQQLVMSPEVQAIGVHREAGLAGQLLILTTA
jgi:uncharacterized protein (DUF1330 family)